LKQYQVITQHAKANGLSYEGLEQAEIDKIQEERDIKFSEDITKTLNDAVKIGWRLHSMQPFAGTEYVGPGLLIILESTLNSNGALMPDVEMAYLCQATPPPLTQNVNIVGGGGVYQR
tara:strand:+ start:249 stop:602 length:354 start_codon:yes stop_codon:yes gene_type:complete